MGPADTNAMADAEAFETDNQQSIEHLRGSAGTIKDIALQVDASVNDQNRMLDRMVRRMELNEFCAPDSTFLVLRFTFCTLCSMYSTMQCRVISSTNRFVPFVRN